VVTGVVASVVPYALKTEGIDGPERIVEDIGVTVPRLGVGGVNGGEACGVGSHPAGVGTRILAKPSMVAEGSEAWAEVEDCWATTKAGRKREKPILKNFVRNFIDIPPQ
jgi:hypothetical protein